MKPSLLTQLGCVGSIVFVLSTSNVAQAETSPTRTIIFSSPQPIKVSSQGNNPEQANISDNQGLEQLSIDRFGCDCNACQNQILQSMQKL